MRKPFEVIAIALLLIIVVVGILFWQGIRIQTNHQATLSTPTPTGAPLKFTVINVTASPSNATPGLVSIVAEIKNQGTENATICVGYQIQEPNGNIMVLPNNSTNLELTAGISKIVTFTTEIPLNSKIGKFNANIDIFNADQTVKYYSTGFIYPFTTPIAFHIFFDGYLIDYGNYYKIVDGITYPRDKGAFYWYIGENHTVNVPNIVINPVGGIGSQFSNWATYDSYQSDGNTLYITVAANASSTIAALYEPYFPNS